MNKGVVAAIAVAVLVGTGLYFAPNSPGPVAQEEDHVHEPGNEGEVVTELDEKVTQAVEMIQSGEGSPMAAIALLREVLTEDSNHVAAHYWLGEFSITSQQFEKAEKRFERVLELESDNATALFKLVQVRVTMNKRADAVVVLEAFLRQNPNHPETEKIQEVLVRIQE